jgi:hypothetical protein
MGKHVAPPGHILLSASANILTFEDEQYGVKTDEVA